MVTAEAPKLLESRTRICGPPVVMLALNRTERSATVTPAAASVELAPQAVIHLEVAADAPCRQGVAAAVNTSANGRASP